MAAAMVVTTYLGSRTAKYAVGVSVGPGGGHALLTSLSGLVLPVGGIVLHYRVKAVS